MSYPTPKRAMTPSRPLTHDLFKNFAIEFGLTVTEIVIYNLKEGIFYSKLTCTNGNEIKEIDARTSDAIAMAVRFNCPIYTYEFILASAGVVLDESGEEVGTGSPTKKSSSKKTPVEKKAITGGEGEFASQTVEELKESLMKAIDDEAYETASKIRDELNKRKKSSQ